MDIAPVRFDIRDPRFLGGDRHPEYRRLRASEPCARLGPNGSWVVARYADCARLLADRSTRKRPPEAPVPPVLGDGPAARMYRSTMAVNDPPNHTRMRRLVGHAFTPRALERLRPRIEEIADSAIADALRAGTLDAMPNVACRVPMNVMCELLSIPDDEWEMLAQWTEDFIRMFFAEGQDAAGLAACHAACANFFDYFGRLVAARRATPRDDFVTALVQARDGEDVLSEDELLGTLRSLLTGGFETTMSLIGNMFLSLGRQPEEFAALRADPSLLPNAVEEVLRWEAPIQVERRLLGQDTEVAGTALRAGEQVWLLLASANRDETVFADPDRINVRRAKIEHLSFGGGIHFCLGASLARMEARATLAALTRRCATFDLAESAPRRRPNFLFPVIDRLDVRLSPV